MALSSAPDPGSLVYTYGDGVGTVVEVVGDEASQLLVEYESGSTKRVSLSLRSLRAVDSGGFLVTATRNPALVRTLVSESSDDVVRMLLVDSPDSPLDTKSIKAALVPKWVPEAQWERWWRGTQLKLKANPAVDTSQARRQRYALREVTQQREYELLDLLRQAGNPPATQFGYLRELAELHGVRPLPRQESILLRSRLQWLSEAPQADSWIRIYALAILLDQEWINPSRFTQQMASFCGMPIRWRPLTNAHHIRRAFKALLDGCRSEKGVPEAVWSGLLAQPRHSEWLLSQIARRYPPAQTEGALKAALRSAFPPEPVIAAEPSWVLDLLAVLDGFRLGAASIQVATAIDWPLLADVLVSRVLTLKASDLEKSQIPQIAVNLLKTAASWRSLDTARGAKSLIDRMLQPDAPGYLHAILGEVLLTLEEPVARSSALAYFMTIAPGPTLDGLLADTPSSRPGNAADQLRLLQEVVQASAGSLSGLPKLATSVLDRAEEIADETPVCQIPLLIHIVQCASPEGSIVRSHGLRLEQMLWLRLLQATMNEQGLPVEAAPLVLGPEFFQAVRELVETRTTSMEREALLLRQQLERVGEQLAAARDALETKDKSIEELRRSIGQDRRTPEPGTDAAELLAGLASILAEVERTAHRQKLRPEAAGQLLLARLQRWTRQVGLEAVGQIGQVVEFDPDWHEIVDGSLGLTHRVEILEAAYRRIDADGKGQCIKHALVRATGV